MCILNKKSSISYSSVENDEQSRFYCGIVNKLKTEGDINFDRPQFNGVPYKAYLPTIQTGHITSGISSCKTFFYYILYVNDLEKWL